MPGTTTRLRKERDATPMVEAACLALYERGGGPLHYEEIASAMRALGLTPRGAPILGRSVQTRICEQLRELGERAWFRRVGPGRFELAPEGRAMWSDPEP